MRRKEIILSEMRRYEREGISTSQLSDILHISRENISRELNQLVRENKIIKIQGKPVIYKPILKSNKTILDDFMSKNPSLSSIVTQAKSAIMYPPMGINTLITGETGVGKSMFAQLMYDFGREMSVVDEHAPFISFNCSDYAHNADLLMGQLFGVKKGAYTGATDDKQGLIELADMGFLFLDEIHCLPKEGQEMLFTFIDHGKFRRLGESEKERSGTVRILGATSESIESNLVAPFRRRMPMVIHLPNLEQRTEKERASLIIDFFKKEATILKEKMEISKDVFIALLYYHCPHNIGQLKSDIQLVCAKGYSEYLLEGKETISIELSDIPDYIEKGLYEKVEHRDIRKSVSYVPDEKVLFNGGTIIDDESASQGIYQMIDQTLRNNENTEEDSNVRELVEKEITEYFETIQKKDSLKKQITLENIVPDDVIELGNKLVTYSEEKLKLHWNDNMKIGFIIHLHNFIESYYNNITRDMPKFNDTNIRANYPNEFLVALDCLEMISHHIQGNIPYGEALNLVSFFINAGHTITGTKKVRIFVISHGESTATSMANTANALLQSEEVIGINAPLDEKPNIVLDRLLSVIEATNKGEDVLCLVDMGSLTSFSKLLMERLNIYSKTIPLVSTLHVIEAARKSMMGMDLQRIYQDLLAINYTMFDAQMDSKNEAVSSVELFKGNVGKPLAIITCCLTGNGTAVHLKKILEDVLEQSLGEVEVIPIQLENSNRNSQKIYEISRIYKVLCIVSTFKINTSIPQFDLYEIMEGTGIEIIQKMVEEETTLVRIKDLVNKELKLVNGYQLCEEVQLLNHSLTYDLSISITTSQLIGIVLHTCLLVERLKENKVTEIREDVGYYKAKYQQLFLYLRDRFRAFEVKYQINISDSDLCYLIDYYLQIR